MKLSSLNTFQSLIKFKVSIAVTFTAITGYVVYKGNIDISIVLLLIGVFILAGGASAFNEFQEREYDAKMARTRLRPIPSGKILPNQALIISILFILAGTFVLFVSFGKEPALLGLFNIFWYNLLYTNLKRVTSFAVVPGSLVGAIPVLIGWTAAGGYLFDSTIVFIAFFLFVWQVPHFWLLMLKYGKEYEEAGFPTINQTVNPSNLRMIIFSWMIATSLTSIMIPLFLVHFSWIFFLIIFVFNILFISILVKLSIGNVAKFDLKKSFVSINVYMLIFMILLVAFHVFVI